MSNNASVSRSPTAEQRGSVATRMSSGSLVGCKGEESCRKSVEGFSSVCVCLVDVVVICKGEKVRRKTEEDLYFFLFLFRRLFAMIHATVPSCSYGDLQLTTAVGQACSPARTGVNVVTPATNSVV